MMHLLRAARAVNMPARSARCRFMFAAALAGMLALPATSAHAEHVLKYSYCNAGEFLVGLMAVAGDHVDGVGAVCAPFDRKTGRLGSSHDMALIAAGGGGTPQHPVCASGMAVSNIAENEPQPNNGAPIVQHVFLTCQGIASPHAQSADHPHIETGGEPQPTRDGPVNAFGAGLSSSTCSAGMLAAGVAVFVDRTIETISLHCIPWSTAKAPGGQ